MENIAEEYKDKILEKYKKYNPYILTDDDDLYTVCISIKNNKDILEIEINEKYITISYKDWYDLFELSIDELNKIMKILDDFISENICIITVKSCSNYLYRKYSSNLNYNKNDILELLANETKNITSPFHNKNVYSLINENGAEVYVTFWNVEKCQKYVIEKRELEEYDINDEEAVSILKVYEKTKTEQSLAYAYVLACNKCKEIGKNEFSKRESLRKVIDILEGKIYETLSIKEAENKSKEEKLKMILIPFMKRNGYSLKNDLWM